MTKSGKIPFICIDEVHELKKKSDPVLWEVRDKDGNLHSINGVPSVKTRKTLSFHEHGTLVSKVKVDNSDEPTHKIRTRQSCKQEAGSRDKLPEM